MKSFLLIALVLCVSSSLAARKHKGDKGSTGDHAASICGNGIVEIGEDCDGSSCCTPTCTIAPSKTICRPSINSCDRPEFCNGNCKPKKYDNNDINIFKFLLVQRMLIEQWKLSTNVQALDSISEETFIHHPTLT